MPRTILVRQPYSGPDNSMRPQASAVNLHRSPDATGGSARRLCRAIVAVGSEALRTAIHQSRFGARVVSRSHSRSASGDRARMRLKVRRAMSASIQNNPDIAVHLFDQHFHCFTAGKKGLGARTLSRRCACGQLSSLLSVATAVASSSTSMPAFSVAGFESGSGMNGAPNALTLGAWLVVSVPGATCPQLPEIVVNTWAACNAGDSEKKGIFPVDEHLASCRECIGGTGL